MRCGERHPAEHQHHCVLRAFRSANVVLPPFVTKRWCQKCPQGTSVGIGRRFSLSGHKRLRCFAHPLRALEPPSFLFPPAVHCGSRGALRATMISVAAIYFQQAARRKFLHLCGRCLRENGWRITKRRPFAQLRKGASDVLRILPVNRPTPWLWQGYRCRNSREPAHSRRRSRTRSCPPIPAASDRHSSTGRRPVPFCRRRV